MDGKKATKDTTKSKACHHEKEKLTQKLLFKTVVFIMQGNVKLVYVKQFHLGVNLALLVNINGIVY